MGEEWATAAVEGHLVWAARRRADGRPGPGVRIWRYGGAHAVASPQVSGRDRLAVGGDGADAVTLVRRVLPELSPTYRPFGDARLIGRLAREIPGLGVTDPFYWMETASPPPVAAEDARWLDSDAENEAAALFDLCFPGSYAQPGRAGVRRWAGARGECGRLLAVAADAWSGAGCGLLAGVVAHPEARGRGLGAAVSAYVTAALVREYGRAALMVAHDNAPAIATYERIGMTGRLFLAAARV